MPNSEIGDQLAIMQLIARYYQAIDRLDFAGWAACFVEGGRFEGAFEGYDAHQERDRFEADSRQLLRRWPSLRHHATSPVIALAGDKANAESNFAMTSTVAGDDPQEPHIRMVMSGRYVDELERVDDAWFFRTRRSLADPSGAGSIATEDER